MRFLQSALITVALLFITGTAQVGESPESDKQVQAPDGRGRTTDHGVTYCCNPPIRGNIDCDQYDLVDVMDLVYLIDWMFRGGPEPPCMREANVDGSCCADPASESVSDISIADLVYLVEYLFIDGPPPAPSPTTERWEKTYGGAESDNAISVAQVDDGGYMTVGTTLSYGDGDSDVYVVRTDAWGDTIWTKTYGGPQDQAAYAVAAVQDGGFVAVGYTASSRHNFDIYVLKVDEAGDLMWQRTFGGPDYEIAFSVVGTPDGGSLVAGQVLDSVYAGGAYCLKLDAAGGSIWAKSYGDLRVATSVAATSDGGYIVAGASVSGGISLLKTDSLGDSLWIRTYNGSYWSRSVIQNDDGGFSVAGTVWNNGETWDDILVIRTDSLGEMLWTKAFGDYGFDYGSSIVQTTDGCYAVTGWKEDIWTGNDYVCLLKLDPQGNTLWSRIYGGDGYDYGQSVLTCPDGGYIVVGLSDSFQSDGASHYDVYLIKTDSLGWSQ